MTAPTQWHDCGRIELLDHSRAVEHGADGKTRAIVEGRLHCGAKKPNRTLSFNRMLGALYLSQHRFREAVSVGERGVYNAEASELVNWPIFDGLSDAEREELQVRARLLRDDHLSADLLDERARSTLGLADPRDYVIRTGG